MHVCQVNVVEAFDQSLCNMSRRLQRLTVSSCLTVSYIHRDSKKTKHSKGLNHCILTKIKSMRHRQRQGDSYRFISPQKLSVFFFLKYVTFVFVYHAHYR